MRIINTFDKIPGCFKNSAFELDAWRAYARAISPELGENANGIRGNMISHDVLPVVNNVLLNRTRRLRQTTFGRRDRQAYEQYRAAF